jgi:queuine tRNA-ribosyltransferase
MAAAAAPSHPPLPPFFQDVGRPLKFEVVATQGRARASVLHLVHYSALTPMFMPVGTQGTVKGLTTEQLEKLDCHVILGEHPNPAICFHGCLTPLFSR